MARGFRDRVNMAQIYDSSFFDPPLPLEIFPALGTWEIPKLNPSIFLTRAVETCF